MKNSKKKVLIAAVLAGVLLLGAIVSIVLVIAAQQQNIASNIRITYSVDGVGAKVSAKYGSVPASGIVNMSDMTTPDGVSTELNFSVSDTNGGASLTPNGDITLTQTTGTEVVFEYRFENTADTLFTIGMKSTGTAVNIAEYYYVSTEPLAEAKYGKIAEPLLNGTTAGELVIPKQAMLSTTTPGNVIYIYVKVAVANINKSASYEKNYDWELKQLTTEQVPFDLALNNGDGSGENSVKVIKGVVVPVMASLPSAPAGKGFAGYYDAQTDGNLIVSKNGIGVKEINTETTLYARYDETSVLDTIGTILFGFNPTASATTATMTTLNVPAEITETAPSAFENNTTLTEVTFGNEVQATGYATGSALKKIGAKAFKGCTGLTELIIPEGVKTIAEGALQNLTNLEHLVLPSTLTSLPGTNTENAPLKGTRKLALLECNSNVIIAGISYSPDLERIPNGLDALYGYGEVINIVECIWYGESAPENLIEIVINSGKTLSFGAFTHNKNLKKITLPNTLKEINNNAFNTCTSLTSIEIPSSVTEIRDGAFSTCTSLTSITIPNSVTTIGGAAFWECKSLTEITIPNSVTTIGEQAFYGCRGLTSITIPNSVTTIGNNTFAYCTSLIEVTIPDSVTTIGNYAFGGCENLTEIKIPNSVTTIGNGVFNYSPIEKLTIPAVENLGSLVSYISETLTEVEINGGTTIPADAFYGCTGLTELVISKGVTEIGNSAFSYCSITKIEAPIAALLHIEQGELSEVIINGGTEIPDGMFYNSSSITSVTIGDSVRTIGDSAFSGCNLTSVIIGDSVETIGDYAFDGCEIISIYYEGTEDEFYAIDGIENLTNVWMVEDGASPNYFLNIKSISDITKFRNMSSEDQSRISRIKIGGSITEIPANAFKDCPLNEVIIGNSVTTIGDSAFSGCGILQLTISESVRYIGHKALDSIQFDTADGYEFIRIDSTNIVIEDDAFDLPYITNYYGSIEAWLLLNFTADNMNISITSGKTIPNRAFNMEHLSSIKISSSIKKIESGAFAGCNDLSDIYYSGTIEQWNAIEGSEYHTQYTIHCKDGNITN